MMIKSNAVKIALNRRRPSVDPSGPSNWHTEFFNVTSSVIATRKISLAFTPLSNSESVKLNGLELLNDPGWDYTLSGSEVTFNSSLQLTVGDTVRIRYQA